MTMVSYFHSAPKPKIYTGIVKYRGPLEQKYNSRIYVGVRLDEPGRNFGSSYSPRREIILQIFLIKKGNIEWGGGENKLDV